MANIAPNVQAFESYVSTTIAQNGRVLAHSWNGDARQGILGNDDNERYSVGQAHARAPGQFLDNWCIPVGAKNIDAAHAFIDYVLDPAVSLQELEYIGYDTVVDGHRGRGDRRRAARADLLHARGDEEAHLRHRPGVAGAAGRDLQRDPGRGGRVTALPAVRRSARPRAAPRWNVGMLAAPVAAWLLFFFVAPFLLIVWYTSVTSRACTRRTATPSSLRPLRRGGDTRVPVHVRADPARSRSSARCSAC